MSRFMDRDFKGVWIPREIYLASDLSWSEKILLIEIDQLDTDPQKGCFASNGYLGEFLDLSPGRTANMVSNLKSRGWLIQLFFDGKNRGLRTSFHDKKLHKKVKDNLNGKVKDKLHEKVIDASRKRESEPSRKREHSKTIKESLVIKEKREKKRAKTVDELITELCCEPAYEHINIPNEAQKAAMWVKNNPGRQFTQRFFVSWLNRIPAPLANGTNGNVRQPPGCDVCLKSEYRERMSLKPGEIYDKARNVVTKCECVK